ncbi:MAG: hypothetical protein LUF91_00765 [Oscillospiraceae bacterium]|nr:hypothetical protein [Oscillospiraceae bacterium]
MAKNTKHTHKHETIVAHECDSAGHRHHHHADGSCCCEAHFHEYHGVDKLLLGRLIAAAIFYLCGMLFPTTETIEAVWMLAAALMAGYDIIWSALRNLVHLRFFDENFLMAFAAVAACIIGEFEEGAAVFLLYRIGEFCQSCAIRRSRKKIFSLTGEAVHPVDNEAEIPSVPFITRFSRIYTPAVLIIAVLIALALPLFADTAWKDAVYRALTFLVLACPCAIVISVPMTYFAGIGTASRQGIFFRDSTALDAVAQEQPDSSALLHTSVQGKPVHLYARSGKPDVGAAEFVLTDECSGIDTAVSIARHTRLILHVNIWFTILVKIAVLVLGAFGISRLWFAVFADSGVTIIVVLNSLCAFFYRGKNQKTN